MNWTLLRNSLLVAGLTTLLAGAVGFVAALALAGINARARRWLMALTLMAVVFPPFLVTNCWLDLLGQNGALHRWLPIPLYSMWGAVWLLTLIYWPVTALLTLGAWNRLESPQLESDPALRGLALVRWLLWPMARGTAGIAALLTFVLALSNFAVPVILQVPVFPEELWLAFTTRLNASGAWAAAWPLVLAPMVLLLLLRHRDVAWPRVEGSATARALRTQLGGAHRMGCRSLLATMLVFSVAVPWMQLASSQRTWTELPNLFRAASGTVVHSLTYAAMAATACMVLGFLTWRWRPAAGLWLLFFVPGILLGQALLVSFQETLIYNTTALVVLAFTLRYAGAAWSGVATALRATDRDVIDAARLDGARGWSLLRHGVWPQIAPQIAATWYAVYLLCLWEVETLYFVQPPGGETLSLRAFNMLHYGHTAQVNALCIVLLGLALLPWLVWSVWPSRHQRQK